MRITYEVKTTPRPDGSLLQTVDQVRQDGSRENLTSHIVNLQEAQTREALVRLGWTPPDHGQPKPLGYAGVIAWAGDTVVRQCISQEEMDSLHSPLSALLRASDYCIDSLVRAIEQERSNPVRKNPPK